MKAGSLLIFVGLAMTLPSGCGSQQQGEAGDCVSPLKFGERTYVWTPAGNQYVTPGDEVGTATIESVCADSPDETPAERTVYAFPNVSPDEALVVVDAQGNHGTVYRSETTPSSGWDTDFATWLDETGALGKQDG
jgi:hypothetical protein